MFKNIIKLWQGKYFLTQTLEDFRQMLDKSEEMFRSVCAKLIRDEKSPDLKEKIYSLDRQVNELERGIRKRVIEHLSMQPSVDLPASLLLMSVVKDAERLGDYSKNLFEVSKFIDKPIDKAKYSELFDDIDQSIERLFKQTKKAFIESDENKATESWDFEREIVKRCDQIIEKLAKSNMPVNEAVALTLMARYFKRIAAHLTNIATSVILPVSDLDYFDERRIDDETS